MAVASKKSLPRPLTSRHCRKPGSKRLSNPFPLPSTSCRSTFARPLKRASPTPASPTRGSRPPPRRRPRRWSRAIRPPRRGRRVQTKALDALRANAEANFDFVKAVINAKSVSNSSPCRASMRASRSRRSMSRPRKSPLWPRRSPSNRSSRSRARSPGPSAVGLSAPGIVGATQRRAGRSRPCKGAACL